MQSQYFVLRLEKWNCGKKKSALCVGMYILALPEIKNALLFPELEYGVQRKQILEYDCILIMLQYGV